MNNHISIRTREEKDSDLYSIPDARHITITAIIMWGGSYYVSSFKISYLLK